MNKPQLKVMISLKFNERVQLDLFFLFDKTWMMLIDECIRYRIAALLPTKSGQDILRALIRHW
eukprot:7166442-Pyramimonas_sp.AAC.1